MIEITEIEKNADTETAFVILICRLFVGTIDANEVNAFLSKRTIYPSRFYYLVQYHKIRPVVLKTIQKHHINISETILTKLVDDCRQIAINSLIVLNQTEKLIQLFAKQGGQIIPYKGVTFAGKYYGDWGMRESSDIDFLIRKEDLQLVQKIILAEGYTSRYYIPDNRQAYIDKCVSSFDVNNDTATKRNFHLEFHYHIIDHHAAMTVNNDCFMNNTSKLKTNNNSIVIPSHQSTIILILTHHCFNDIMIYLKYYIDLAMLCKLEDNKGFDAVIEFSKKHGVYKNWYIGMQNMSLLFGIPNPFGSTIQHEQLSRDVLQLALDDRTYHLKTWNRLLLRIKTRDHFKWKYRMVKGVLKLVFVPSPSDYKLINLPKVLHPAYYIIKPFRLLSKKLSGNKFQFFR